MDSIGVPLGLIALSFGSLIDLYLHEQPRLGRIRLVEQNQSNGGLVRDQEQENEDGNEEQNEESEKEEDAAKEEGIPVELNKWWLRVRMRKAALIVVLALLDATSCVSLGWDSVSGAKDRFGIAEHGLMLAFWTLLVVLAILSFPQKDIAIHWRYTVHLSVLTLVSSISIWSRILIPSSSIGIPTTLILSSKHSSEEIVSFALTVTTAALSLIAFLLVGTTPQAPPYHFTSPYAPESVTDASEKLVPNVSENINASVLSTLLFSWVGPVIREGYRKPQMGLEDLPHLSSSFRTITLFRNFRSSSKQSVEKEQAKAQASSRIAEEAPRDGLGYAPSYMNRLLWRLIVINKLAFTLNTVLAFVTALLYYLPAFFLQKVVKFLERSHEVSGQDRTLGYAYCFGLLLSLVLDTIATGQLWYISNCMLSSRIRIQLNSIIFAKTLKRKDMTGISSGSDDSSDADSSGGKKNDADDEDTSKVGSSTFSSKTQVLNLFSVDTDRVGDSASWSFSLIDAPVELVIGTIFLYQLLGYAGIVGIATTILFLPINHYTSKTFAVVADKLMAARDKRVGLMNEVLSSIRYIKFMAYEKPFEKRILAARDEELRQQRNNYLLEVAFNFIWGTSPIACVLVSFYVFTKVMGRDLTPSIAFTSLAVFNELRYAINVLPDTFISALQCFVSIRRIQNYLDLPDVENTGSDNQIVSLRAPTNFSDLSPPVSFINATVTWPSADNDEDSDDSTPHGARTPATGSRTPFRKFMMPDVHVEFPVGELTLVCGPLGSGKTLLLLALLGEADLLSGQILCPRSPVNTLTITSESTKISDEDWIIPVCAYVPQSAFLLNATIKDNILFGLPYHETRYSSTLEVCSLLSDLAILEDGDQTEIGEKGVNLSGGQKARVSLARAVYSRAGYLFLDDVLSAVDAHTAAHLFERCLKGPLLRNRTVILVSHHIQLCAPGAKFVVHLDNGMVSFTGSADEYMQTPLYGKESAEDGPEEEQAAAITNKPKPKNKVLQQVAHTKGEISSSASVSSLSEMESSEDETDEEDLEGDKAAATPRKLIEEETRAVGSVSFQVWLYYLKANGHALFWALFAFIFVGAKGMEVLETYWVRIWSNSYDVANGSADTSSVNYYLGVYALITAATVIVDTLQWLILYDGGIRASVRMYKIILHNTLRAPLRFFDTMAQGRLLNRFGKDMEVIDAQLPDNLGKTLMYILGVLTTLATIASVSPVFILAFAVLCVAYSYYGRMYATTAREMRRLDSITKSPIYSLYGEAIAGVAVIRAFGGTARFMLLQMQRVQTNSSFYYYLWAANRWLSVRFSLLSAFLVGVTALILLAEADNINASIAGFALTFALNISSDMLYLVRRYTALELAMVAVERIKDYTDIQQEPPEIVEPRPPAAWPTRGEVSVEDLCIRYAPELPRILHEVSFKVEPGQKVGIVGATGSGKSSLALSFFRFVEADEGRIVIDGIDIGKVGLQDLRSRLTIIPQDPTILSGTIRSSLDPLDEHDDAELFDALKRARLLPTEPVVVPEGEEVNYNQFYDLESPVAEQGSNFSAGERQLMCLARALLKQHPLILMDEATSSVDYETDALITATIAEEFKNSSLLVIAHRLRTVIGFDKILVLDAGRVAEYDSPAKLIQDEESRFHALCKATGKREFKILTRLSKRDYKPGQVLKRKKTKRSSSGRQDSK